MPSGAVNFRHIFGGGLSSERGAPGEVDVGPDGRIVMPFLLRADNIFYLLNGAVKKIGGTSKYNSTTLESGEEVRSVFEYIRQGTSGTPTRKRVAWAGTKVKADNNDGTFADIFTGRTDNSIVCHTVFEDVLILSSDANEAPLKWNQTTATTLGGSPPNFAFSCEHVNRVWAAGNIAAPSVLYYSSLLEAEEWNGAGNSGTITISPDDGDVITGIKAIRGQTGNPMLVVFKGPNKGSIHIIDGATPSTFVRRQIAEGIGSVNHNAIFTYGSDVGFIWRDATIRSLRATNVAGDFEQATLSREIRTLLKERTNFDMLKRAQAASDPLMNYTCFTLPWDSSNVPNVTLMMDTRFEEPRFAVWEAIAAWSVALMSDPAANDQHILYFGGNDGFIRKSQQPDHSIDTSTAITSTVRTPFFFYGTSHKSKTLQALGLGVSPQGAFDIDITYIRESGSGQTSVVQGGGDVLGPADENEFTLDTSTLGGDRYRTRWVETPDSGQFREIAYELSNSGLNEDMEVHAIHAVIETAAVPNYTNED